jgi:hypothetical protein
MFLITTLHTGTPFTSSPTTPTPVTSLKTMAGTRSSERYIPNVLPPGPFPCESNSMSGPFPTSELNEDRLIGPLGPAKDDIRARVNLTPESFASTTKESNMVREAVEQH